MEFFQTPVEELFRVLFQRSMTWLRFFTTHSHCVHGKTKHSFEVTVLGTKCKLEKSLMCPICTERHLNTFSTLCASCERPIFPGTHVGMAVQDGTAYPYVHLTRKCCGTTALYCGQWGGGNLITLHELDPEKYLVGTPSVASHALKSRRGVVENVD